VAKRRPRSFFGVCANRAASLIVELGVECAHSDPALVFNILRLAPTFQAHVCGAAVHGHGSMLFSRPQHVWAAQNAGAEQWRRRRSQQDHFQVVFFSSAMIALLLSCNRCANFQIVFVCILNMHHRLLSFVNHGCAKQKTNMEGPLRP